VFSVVGALPNEKCICAKTASRFPNEENIRRTDPACYFYLQKDPERQKCDIIYCMCVSPDETFSSIKSSSEALGFQ